MRNPHTCIFTRIFASIFGLAFFTIIARPSFARNASPPLLNPSVSQLQEPGADSPKGGQAPESATGNSEQKAHMDHKSKHGGIFFMALDNKHHLEGALLPRGTFRIYLYDDHTKPLKADQVKEASGTVQIGESEDAPKIALVKGKKKETLEAALGEGVKFPIALTVLLRLPEMPPDAKPELFNFSFTKFTD